MEPVSIGVCCAFNRVSSGRRDAVEMACLYRDRARDEGALRLWLALLGDVPRTAPKEQLNVSCASCAIAPESKLDISWFAPMFAL